MGEQPWQPSPAILANLVQEPPEPLWSMCHCPPTLCTNHQNQFINVMLSLLFTKPITHHLHIVAALLRTGSACLRLLATLHSIIDGRLQAAAGRPPEGCTRLALERKRYLLLRRAMI